jgi:hypothetical protein
MMEFLALANHRKAIRAEIAEVTMRSRKVQLKALNARWDEYAIDDELSPQLVLFFMTMIPKMIEIEEEVGLTSGHAHALKLVNRYLDKLEPRRARRTPA